MEEIARAVQHAAYNDAVVVQVLDGGRELVLVATIDQSGGGVVWQDVAATATTADSSDGVAILRHLRTKRWILPMLNDCTRNHMYKGAIQQACQKACAHAAASVASTMDATATVAVAATATDCADTNPHVVSVLDIGTGTGLLAMMAAKFMDQERRPLADHHRGAGAGSG